MNEIHCVPWHRAAVLRRPWAGLWEALPKASMLWWGFEPATSRIQDKPQPCAYRTNALPVDYRHMDLYITLSHKQNIYVPCLHCELSYGPPPSWCVHVQLLRNLRDSHDNNFINHKLCKNVLFICNSTNVLWCSSLSYASCVVVKINQSINVTLRHIQNIHMASHHCKFSCVTHDLISIELCYHKQNNHTAFPQCWLSSALSVDIFSCNFFHKMNIWNMSKWNVPCKFIHHWQYDMIELLLLNHMTVEKLLVWSLVVSRHFRQFAPTFVTRLCYCPHNIRSLKQTVCTKLWYPLPKHLSVLNFNGFDICEISYNLELFVGKDFILWKET